MLETDLQNELVIFNIFFKPKDNTGQQEKISMSNSNRFKSCVPCNNRLSNPFFRNSSSFSTAVQHTVCASNSSSQLVPGSSQLLEHAQMEICKTLSPRYLNHASGAKPYKVPYRDCS